MPSFTKAYFQEEMTRFRELIGNKTMSLENKDKAFEGLTYVYLNLEHLDPADESRMITAYQVLSNDWSARRVYSVLSPAAIRFLHPSRRRAISHII